MSNNKDGTITGEPTLDVLELATQGGALEVNSMNKAAERAWGWAVVVVGQGGQVGIVAGHGGLGMSEGGCWKGARDRNQDRRLTCCFCRTFFKVGVSTPARGESRQKKSD